MKINLNDPDQFTVESVRQLLASEEDTQNWQLRVTKDGIAYLSEETGGINIEGLSFRMETWGAGNSYVGETASKDDAWVNEVYKDLKDNWPSPKSTYIDC